MKTFRISTERGQSVVLLALMFLAFTAILALVLDGGSTYAARRQAQNAADAGALAGAAYMCEHLDEAGGENKAVEYAVKNGAVNPPDVYANLSSHTVIVTATVQTEAFFAGLIGVSLIAPRAVAEAECQPPMGMGILPVAWACRETVVEGTVLPGAGCAQKFGPSNIYILMDSVKVNKPNGCNNPNDADDPTCYLNNDLFCDELLDDNGSGAIDPAEYTTITFGRTDCDINNDGINELMTGGARSWLDLNGGGGGASELSDWIQNGFPDPIDTHTWLPEESGVATSIFHTAASSLIVSGVGKDVILPVFNKICPNYPNDTTPPETNAACNVGPDDDRTLASGGLNFHVATFSKFHVRCVQTGKNKVTAETSLGLKNNDPCPGHQAAFTNGSIEENDKTIEGYFTTDQIFGYGGSGEWVDVGTFVVVLVR